MTTHTVAVPGATLTYDVHGDLEPGVVPLVMVGSPMDASGFTTLRGHVTDRVVVTYDPRNTGRSTRDEPTAAVTPTEHADDLYAVLQDLGVDSVDLLGSSGGAVNAIALTAAHPGLVATLVAHEPPYGSLLPDAEAIRRVCDDVVAAYDAGGLGPAMARFFGLLMHRGPVPDDQLERPLPDPTAFGFPAEDSGDRSDPLVANMRGGGVEQRPDLEALRGSSTRVVIGVGEESGGPEDGELAVRAAYALAGELGLEPTVFPGGHGGFLGGEFGQTGKPVEFAERLREVLG